MALFAPAATIVSNDGSLAPSSRIRWSRSSPTSRSVRPGRIPPASISSASARSATAQARRSDVDLAGVLDRPEPLDQVGRRRRARSLPGSPRRSPSWRRWAATVTDIASNPIDALGCPPRAGPGRTAGRSAAAGRAPRPPTGWCTGRRCRTGCVDRCRRCRLRRSVSGVAGFVVGVEHQQRGVRTGESGEVPDVDQVGDQQRVEPGVRQGRPQQGPAACMGPVRHVPDGRRRGGPPPSLPARHRKMLTGRWCGPSTSARRPPSTPRPAATGPDRPAGRAWPARPGRRTAACRNGSSCPSP